MVRLLSAVALAGTLLGAPLAAQVSGPAPTPESNSLLPGDVIRVQIWREDDLSGEFQVDDQGIVVLPLIGRREVRGISPDKLRDDLTAEYGKYLVNTAVNVTLLRRVNVLGEVRIPGQYTVDATNSVADVIARAQGVTQEGNGDDIVLIRGGQRLRAGLAGTQSLQEAGIRSGDQIVVGKRGWISRNFSSLVGVSSIIANIIVIVVK
jgi:protein involved in polysaccharide export with SLBB domain